MRVLNVMLSEGLGGLEAAFVNYAVALKSQSVEPICCVSSNAKITSAINPELTVIDMARTSEHDPRAVLRAHRLITRIAPDLIVVHGRRAMKIFSTARRLFRHTTPLVNVMHGPRYKYLNRAQHIITVSNQLRSEVLARGIGEKQVTYIPNFLTGHAVAQKPLTMHSPPVIGVLGRFNEVKGVDIFIEAMATLKRKGLDFQIVIGGAGELGNELKELAIVSGVSDRIQWLGWVEDIDAFYDRTDIFCLPSRREAFGIVLLEAMARGKAIVATRTAGPLELLKEGHSAMFCDIDAESMARTIEQLLTQPHTVAALGTNARSESAAYRTEAIGPKIMECFTRVLNASR